MTNDASADLTATVKARYGEAATRVLSGQAASCCGPVSCGCGSAPGTGELDPITSNLYAQDQTAGLPADAILASLGCGNPTALAELRAGDVVLDLGSGGGIDVLLSARRVGPTGKAYGLDMTDEMLALARSNAAKAGAENVEFLRGHIESIPLPDSSVDVIISNCVINLSGDKRQVLQEAFRVLKPGGRFAVSDVVVRGELPPAVRKSMELWVGCVAGALEESEFLDLLTQSGFENPAIEPTRIYEFEDARAFLSNAGEDMEVLARQVSGCVMGARSCEPRSPFRNPRRWQLPAAAHLAVAPDPGGIGLMGETIVTADGRAVSLRRATETDLDAALQLLADLKLPTAGVTEWWQYFIVAESFSVIVGLVGIETYGAGVLLRSVAVLPDWRSTGIGRALVNAALGSACEAGARDAYLLTTTAEHYFPRLGFTPMPRAEVPATVQASVEFRTACPASAVVMHRPLTNPGS